MNKRTLKKNIKKWLKDTEQGDLKITIDFDQDFMFDDTENEIIVGDYDRKSKDFEKLNKRLGLNGDYNDVVMSMLHELGHYNTYMNYGDLAEKYDTFVRNILYKLTGSDSDLLQDIGLWLYYRILPQEIAATKWGVEYANNYPNETKQLEIAMQATDIG